MLFDNYRCEMNTLQKYLASLICGRDIDMINLSNFIYFLFLFNADRGRWRRRRINQPLNNLLNLCLNYYCLGIQKLVSIQLDFLSDNNNIGD